MKRTIIIELIVPVLLNAVAPAGAGTIFWDDFERGNVEGWTWFVLPCAYYPHTVFWGIESDGTKVMSGEGGLEWGGGDGAALIDKHFLSDFSIQADVKVVEVRNAGSHHAIIGRYTPIDFSTYAFYAFSIGGDTGEGCSARLLRKSPCSRDVYLADLAPRQLKNLDLVVRTGEWHRLKMTFCGENIKCFIDDVLVINVFDSVLKSGVFGLLTSGGHSHFDNVKVETVNRPPPAKAGPDRRVEATSADGALVELDASASLDPEGDPLTFTWREDGRVIAGPTGSPIVGVTLGMGSHEIELLVEDGQGGADTDSVTILVSDTTPPRITVTLDPYLLWPPTLRMVDIHATVNVTDACDDAPLVTLTTITCNEFPNEYWYLLWLFDIRGASVGTADYDFQLRSACLRPRIGRVYYVTYTAVDASGNSASVTATVSVMRRPSVIAECEDVETAEQRNLLDNYPNPFNTETTIRYRVTVPSHVSLRIYDDLGKEIRRLTDEFQPAGRFLVRWDGRDEFGTVVSSGVYFARLDVGGAVQTTKLLVIR